MNTATFRTVANSLIVGAVLGFIGGAWTYQATHAGKPGGAETGKDDITSNAILSSLSRIRNQCASLEQQVSAKTPVPAANAALRGTSFQNP